MKIVATVSDFGAAINIGGNVEYRSAIIKIPDDQVPELVKKYFQDLKWAKEAPNRNLYGTLSFSLLEEET